MATNNSGKLPTPGHVIYDSRNDMSTGKKRAVLPGGGVSVAERARLFGTQISAVSSKKERPAVNQSIKSNVVHQDRNYQQINKNVDRRPNNDHTYYTPQKVSHHHHQSPVRNDPRTNREQPSSRVTKQNPHSHQHSSTRYQPSSSYDNFQHVHSQPRKNPDESSSSRYPTHQTSNYFQPIQDPLDVLLNHSSQTYYQHHIPIPTHNNASGLQPFDLGNLINRIQQDYVSNVQPYVSSVQFVDNTRSLADIGFITPASNRKDYTRQFDDGYGRQGSSHHYDFIDTNGFHLYEKKPSRQSYTNNQYSSMTRRKHRTRYHDQASSPIHILETSNKTNPQHQSDNAPIPKPPSPPAETEDEETTTSHAEVSKSAEGATTEVDATTDSESEEPSKDEPSEKPVTTPSLPKSVNGPASTPTVLPKPTVVKKIESEESETEESGSSSDSESESEEEKPKPMPKPSPATRSNKPPSTSGTPITRSANTPQINTRGTPQRITTDDNSTNQPSEPSGSVKSFDPEETGKSSSFGSKFKSITNKFRRKK